MKKNSVLVKQVLMSIVTAGIFSFSFALTSCSDDEFTNNVNNTEDGSDKIGNYADFEPYGLTYHNFDGEDDVKIMNADTTEIAVKKSLAGHLGRPRPPGLRPQGAGAATRRRHLYSEGEGRHRR